MFNWHQPVHNHGFASFRSSTMHTDPSPPPASGLNHPILVQLAHETLGKPQELHVKGG